MNTSTDISLHPLEPEHVDEALEHIRALLIEVEALGGRRVSHAPEGWAKLRGIMLRNLDDPDCLMIFAQRGHQRLAYLEARVTTADMVFAPQRSVHISVVRVDADQRRQGIARQLVEHALDWGRSRSCSRASLHVVPQNPARHLYDDLGFETTDLTMTMDI